MVKIFGLGSRLIIVFILTVIISGSILTYLSINNISNYKELTEKKVTEEQLFLARQVSESFRNELERVAGDFTDVVVKNGTTDLQNVKHSDTIDGITNPFMINSNGQFLWPWFIDDGLPNDGKGQTAFYKKKFKRAEKEEFSKQNLNSARAFYIACLKGSSGKVDSARVLNALARLSVKMKQNEQALSYYTILISKYYSVLNKNGFPYVYYSVIQLLKISDSINKKKVFEDIIIFLARLESGEIPLNHSTSEILTQISNWITNSGLTDNKAVPDVIKYITRINSYLEFMTDHRDVIRKSLVLGRKPESPLIMGIYNSISTTSPDNSKLILINSDLEFTTGFMVELKQIWFAALNEKQSLKTDFEYDIELMKKGIEDISNKNRLVTLIEISPYFTSYLIRVKLKNENLIEKYVKKRKWVYGIALILLLGGMLLGLYLILQDFNREKKLASLRSDFVSNVTHDLKTPLTSIHMFAESIFLGRAKSRSSQKKYANIIIKESENLQRMINNILGYSVKEKYQFKEANLSNIVESTLSDMSYWLEINKFNVVAEIQEDVITKIDSEAIKQALSNLINNAIKYSPTSKNLIVRLIKMDKKIMIEVEDTGIGIPENQTSLIFEKFYRVKSKETETTSGTGLGLTVTKSIIEAHNGKLLVDSEFRKGSKFTIVIDI